MPMGVLFTLVSLLELAVTLRIAAFNIRTFGETKMSNATISSYIVKVSSGWPMPESRQTPGEMVTSLRPRKSVSLRPYQHLGGCQGCRIFGCLMPGAAGGRAVHPACLAKLLWPFPQILSRYDIAVVQEVRDSHLVATGKLLDELNRWVTVLGSTSRGAASLPPSLPRRSMDRTLLPAARRFPLFLVSFIQGQT